MIPSNGISKCEPPVLLLGGSDPWDTRPDGTFKCETPVEHTARWYNQLRTTGGTRRLMLHSSASHRWDTPPDGTFNYEPPVGHAARWYIQVRATGGTRLPMVHSSISIKYQFIHRISYSRHIRRPATEVSVKTASQTGYMPRKRRSVY
ncbi:hypothetical protein AVEN_118095-1 [Araneus ventricosus]|uniref:Uncharacterized protein n=1 Tax=Araneus ventricosus TaxID=182803 RepID=A0A4Y2J003_ARAVE|nr:hypothetical protein AVEN_118095-1 [Araneus ventricosus]